ncbi:MAG TPA: response regulator transcription factor [bacterium]|jgi:DNA-binding response OmpR family regulator|nr:response regulator transcription factor [bacterium]
MKKLSILMIEDDPAILAVARDLLEKEGYEVDSADTCAGGFQKLSRKAPDLLVLDLNLPDGDGLQLCRRLGASPVFREVPVMVVTARGSTQDIVEGLEAGAHDYMVKPFNVREFVARVRSIVRRNPGPGPKEKELSSGRLRMSKGTHEVWNDGKPVTLTLREFDVLRVLMEDEGRVLSREDIIARAWGPATSIAVRVIDVHVSHLRAKLAKEGKRVETVPQVGFKLALAKK